MSKVEDLDSLVDSNCDSNMKLVLSFKFIVEYRFILFDLAVDSYHYLISPAMCDKILTFKQRIIRKRTFLWSYQTRVLPYGHPILTTCFFGAHIIMCQLAVAPVQIIESHKAFFDRSCLGCLGRVVVVVVVMAVVSYLLTPSTNWPRKIVPSQGEVTMKRVSCSASQEIKAEILDRCRSSQVSQALNSAPPMGSCLPYLWVACIRCRRQFPIGHTSKTVAAFP